MKLYQLIENMNVYINLDQITRFMYRIDRIDISMADNFCYKLRTSSRLSGKITSELNNFEMIITEDTNRDILRFAKIMNIE